MLETISCLCRKTKPPKKWNVCLCIGRIVFVHKHAGTWNHHQWLMSINIITNFAFMFCTHIYTVSMWFLVRTAQVTIIIIINIISDDFWIYIHLNYFCSAGHMFRYFFGVLSRGSKFRRTLLRTYTHQEPIVVDRTYNTLAHGRTVYLWRLTVLVKH